MKAGKLLAQRGELIVGGARPYLLQIGQMADHALDHHRAVHSFTRKVLDIQIHGSRHPTKFAHGHFHNRVICL